MCTHPCSTHQPPHPQVVSIATTAQAKMKLWKETSRSSKITTSSRCGLAATPSRLPVKAALSTFLFRTLIYCKNYMDVSDVWCNQLLFPFNTILSTVWWCPYYVTAVYVNNWSWHVHGSHSVYLLKPGVTVCWCNIFLCDAWNLRTYRFWADGKKNLPFFSRFRKKSPFFAEAAV